VATGETTIDEALALIRSDSRFAERSLNEQAAGGFGRVIAPAKLVDLERITGDWRPDLIVHEWTDLAAPIAAAVAGVPTVSQGLGLVLVPGLTMPDWRLAETAPLWRSRGMDPAPYAGTFGALHLHPMPHSLQPDASVPVGDLQPIRLEPPPYVGDSLPSWANELDPSRRPVVYVSLGTTSVFSQPELLRIVLDGVANVDVDVVVTVGAHNDPASFGSQPGTVHLERWLPLPQLLSRCSLVVCHGGSGTLLASLAAGLPLVLLPRGSDQFDNAAACARAGVARVVPPQALDSDAVATDVQRLLDDRSYRDAAACLRAEIEAMPAPVALVPRLERLVATEDIFAATLD
jgi:hypothetical protein